MKKKINRIVAWVIIPLILFSIPLIITIINDIRLNIFAEQLFSYQLPPSTEMIMRHKETGNMNGTGDNFGYWIYIVISTDLSEQEIMEYYNTANFQGGKYLRVDVIPYNLARTTTSKTYSRTVETEILVDNKYIIQLYNHDESILGLFDLRRG